MRGERSGNPSAGRGIRRQTAETGRDTPFENIFLPFCKRFTNKINTYNQQITNKLPNFTRNKLDIFIRRLNEIGILRTNAGISVEILAVW